MASQGADLMTKKICPLIFRAAENVIPAMGHCKESACMFWAIKKKSHVNEDGNIVFVDASGYCLVRDFLVSVTNRE